MARIGVLRTLSDGKLGFECPGCGAMHALNVDPAKGRPAWSWNGSYDRPTFSPSVLVQYERRVSAFELSQMRKPEDARVGRFVCHSFVRDGHLEFLPDCTHELAGKTVPLPAEDPT